MKLHVVIFLPAFVPHIYIVLSAFTDFTLLCEQSNQTANPKPSSSYGQEFLITNASYESPDVVQSVTTFVVSYNLFLVHIT